MGKTSNRKRHKRSVAFARVQLHRKRLDALREQDAPVFNNARYGAKSKVRTRGKPLPKARYAKWDDTQLLDRIRAMVLESIAKYPDRLHTWFTIEGVARDLKARLPLVAKCFMKLNQEGLLCQKTKRESFDWSRGGEQHTKKPGSRVRRRVTGWNSNIYRVRLQEQ
jgi:hypothetical protein